MANPTTTPTPFLDEDYNELLKASGRGGQPTGQLTVADCMVLVKALKTDDERKALPSFCTLLLDKAARSKLLRRRTSAVGRAWDVPDGHGRQRYSQSEGGAHDNASAGASSVTEMFLAGKSDEAKAKIRHQMARTMSKGGKMRAEASVCAKDVADKNFNPRLNLDLTTMLDTCLLESDYAQVI